jgi:hypothetical protein
MSADASVTFPWGDGPHTFRLALGQLRELQDKCGAGPIEVLDRLRERRWRVEDVREPIRLGLVGGGMDPLAALVLVDRYVDQRPSLAENVRHAQGILIAALIGVPDDPVGKAAAERTATAGSASPPSTEPAPPWDGTRPPSIGLPFGSSPPQSTDGTGPRAETSSSPSPSQRPSSTTCSPATPSGSPAPDRVGEIQARFGGRELTFRLERNERAVACFEAQAGTAFAMFQRFATGHWSPADVALVLAHASVGAPNRSIGLDPAVDEVVARAPAGAYAPLAVKALEAFLFGVPPLAATFDEATTT